ncbi:MAG: PilZ domain-containing protein, partial [Candidatus Omnitrophica bacterium]|nr:PilZ domain-containing protein [Candidatus Omnitrophota bacterium]
CYDIIFILREEIMEEKVAKEERLYERLNLPLKLNYEVLTRPHDLKNTVSKNISGGGICISITEKLLPGTKLNISIMLPKNAAKPAAHGSYAIKATVVWSRPVEIFGNEEILGYYDTGIQFLEDKPVIIGRIVACFYGRQF